MSDAKGVLEEIRPSEENNRAVKEVVGEVVEWLKADLKPTKIVKGGSYGKGTHIKGRNEVDLVVVFPGPLSACSKEECSKYCALILQCLTKHTTSATPDAIKTREKKGWSSPTQEGEVFVKMHAVSFRMNDVSFDVLPAYELGSPEDLFHLRREQLEFASASTVKFQVDFVKHQDARYKDLVRYCKKWRNLYTWESKSAKPSSYLLELLALHAYELLTVRGGSTVYSLELGFKTFLDVLLDEKLSVMWSRFYEPSSNGFRLPLVLDPGNPRNNVCSRLTRWDTIRAHAKATLSAITTPDL